jgi:hypothetical protein
MGNLLSSILDIKNVFGQMPKTAVVGLTMDTLGYHGVAILLLRVLQQVRSSFQSESMFVIEMVSPGMAVSFLLSAIHILSNPPSRPRSPTALQRSLVRAASILLLGT